MTATATRTASPKKLRNGSWGAIADTEQVIEGDELVITSKAGKTWTATVDKVIWRGNGVTICATASRPAPRRRRQPVDHEDCLSFAGCVHGSSNCDYH